MSDRPLELIFGVNDTNPLDVTWGPWMFAGMDYRPARKRVDLVTSEDSDGALPLGQAKADNMIMGLRLRVDEGASMDAALDQMHRLQKKLDDAARRAPDGLECVWRPEGASERSTFFVLEGEIAESPQEMSGADIGWYHKSPILVVTLICKPFFYGDWSTPVVASGSTPVVTLELENVAGDVDAEGEMIVTDLESVDRSHFEWGLEQYGYDPVTPSDVILNLDGSDLVVTGYEGTSTAVAGSYSTNVVVGGAYGGPVTRRLCGIARQPHVGSKRVRLRGYVVSSGTYIRLVHRVGDGPFTEGPWVRPAPSLTTTSTARWSDIDLGVITIPTLESGTQAWDGYIEILDESVTSRQVVVDYVAIIPVERYGKLRAPESGMVIESLTESDDFSLCSGAVTGDTASGGGAWAWLGASGDTADFQDAAAGITRTEVSDAAGSGVRMGRILVLGDEVYSDTYIEITAARSAGAVAVSQGAVCRANGPNDFVAAYINSTSTDLYVNLVRVLAGVETTIEQTVLSPVGTTAVKVAAMVFESGLWRLFADGVLLDEGTSASLCAAAISSGKVGILDYQASATANTRTYTNFRAGVPSEARVCFADQEIEITHDRAERYDSSGVYIGTPPQDRGSRLWIPPEGDQAKTSRIVTKMRRNDVDTLPDSTVGDEHSISVRWRARHRNPIGTA